MVATIELGRAAPAAAGAYPNLTGSILDPSSWSAHEKMFSVGDAGVVPATVYWPWVIRTDNISAPLDAYYLYYSTDHDATLGGIYMAHGPTPRGPWTHYGLVYRDTSSTNGQTETPSVLWDAFSSSFRMFYQQQSAKYGASNASSAVGTQSTLSATSTDGIAWTKDPSFILDKPFNSAVVGDGHTGYFIPSRTPRGLMAYSLAGGTSLGLMIKWTCNGPLGVWATDWAPLSRSEYLTQGSPLNGRRVEWNSAVVVSSAGVDYLIHRLSDGASGVTAADCLIGAAPISPNYRELLERPVPIWTPTEAWESSDMRCVTSFIEDGVLYVYYTIGKLHVGVFTHVL